MSVKGGENGVTLHLSHFTLHATTLPLNPAAPRCTPLHPGLKPVRVERVPHKLCVAGRDGDRDWRFGAFALPLKRQGTRPLLATAALPHSLPGRNPSCSHVVVGGGYYRYVRLTCEYRRIAIVSVDPPSAGQAGRRFVHINPPSTGRRFVHIRVVDICWRKAH